MAKQPPISAPTWSLPPGTKLVLEVPMSGKSGLDAGYNTGVAFQGYAEKLCGAEWILGADGKALSMLVETADEWLLNPACYLTTGKGWQLDGKPSAQDIDKRLTHLERTQFMAVIRVREHEVPAYADPAPGEKLSRYTVGRVRGDVLVYEIATEKLVGAFPVDVTLPETVEVSDRALEQLATALTGVASDYIQAKLQSAPQ